MQNEEYYTEGENNEQKDARYYINKGFECYNRKDFKSAINFFNIVEQNYSSELSYVIFECKAKCLELLNNYEKAVEYLTKAESLPQYGLLSTSLFYSKGHCLYKLKRYDEAIDSLNNVEVDTLFSLTFYLKGLCYKELKRFDEGIKEFYNVKENDLGIDTSSLYLQIGLCYCFLGEYPKAIEELHKVEKEKSIDNYILAIFNKGTCYAEMKEFAKAIQHFDKVEQLNIDGKDPKSSFGKGICYSNLGKSDEAISSYQKAIENSANNHYPQAHLKLAKIYHQSELEKSKYHAFEAIKQDSRDAQIVGFVADHFSVDYTHKIYDNRLNYLDTLFVEMLGQEIGLDNKEYEKRWNKIFKKEKNDENETINIFQALLKNKINPFPDNISYQDRLRVAYLLSYKQNEPWNVYYIIDELLDNDEEDLSGMDMYFYLYSAFQIGESIKELHFKKIENTTAFGIAYNKLLSDIEVILNDNKMADEYLPDFSTVDFTLPNIVTEQNYHQWVNEVLTSLNAENKNYTPPYDSNLLMGLFSQLLKKQADDLLSEEQKNSTEWENFKKSLEDINEKSKTKHLINNIREGIKKGIPHFAFIHVLNQSSFESSNENEKNINALAIAAAIGTYHFDVFHRSIFKNTTFRLVIGGVLGTSAKIGINSLGLIAIGFIEAVSIGVIVGKFVTPKILGLAESSDSSSKQSEVFFENIYKELEAFEGKEY